MNTGYEKEYTKAFLGGFEMLKRASQLDKVANELLSEIEDLTNTKDAKAIQCLYSLAFARELRAWYDKLFG